MLSPVLAVWIATLALVGGATALGAGIERACGWRAPTPLAPAIGFATLLVLTGNYVLTSGHASAAAAAGIVAVLAAGAIAGTRLRPRHGLGPPLAAAGLTLLACCVPFIVSGRVGPLGVGDDDDLSVHLNTTAALLHRVPDAPSLIDQGYPLGPHAIAASLADLLSVSVTHAFLAVMIAMPVIAAVAATAALGELRPLARAAIATLVALPYLIASFLAVAEFKEIGEAVLVLAFALSIRQLQMMESVPWHVHVRKGIPLAMLAAGTLYVYSLPGLAWPAVTLGAAAALAALHACWRSLARRRRAGSAGVTETPGSASTVSRRGIAPGAIGRFALRWLAPLPLAAGVLGLLAAIDSNRLSTFTESSFASEPAHGLGNLVTPLTAWRGIGIWLRPDFRLPAQPAALDAVLTALALLAGIWAVSWWWRRGETAVLGALAATGAIYAIATQTQSPYASAKALAIVGPAAMLVLAAPLVARRAGRPASAGPAGSAQDTARHERVVRGAHWLTRERLRVAIAVVVLGGAVASSMLALRDAPVGPSDHARDLAKLGRLVGHAPTLFLNRDDFAGEELRGVVLARPPGLYPVWIIALRADRLNATGIGVDFLSVTSLTLDRFRYVIAPRSAYDAGPPPNFSLVARTGSYDLWQRHGSTPVLDTVGNGPGATLDCATPRGRAISKLAGVAKIAAAPVVGHARSWSTRNPKVGDPAHQTIALGAGRWALSLQYVARQPLEVSAIGMHFTAPASLDRLDPHWLVGTLTLRAPQTVSITVEPKSFGLLGTLLGATGSVRALDALHNLPLGAIAATRVDIAPRIVPISQACGQWVEWYAPDIAQS